MGLRMVEHSVLNALGRKMSGALQLQDFWYPGAERQTMLNPVRLRMGLQYATILQPGRLNNK